EFARRLLMDLAQITSADWFVLRLAPRDGTDLRLFTWSRGGASERLSFEGTAVSVELQAGRSREDVWFDAHRPLRDSDPLHAVSPRAHGLVHPIFLGDTLIGTLAVAKDVAG